MFFFLDSYPKNEDLNYDFEKNFSKRWNDIFIKIIYYSSPSLKDEFPAFPEEITPKVVNELLPIYLNIYNRPRSLIWRLYRIILDTIQDFFKTKSV